MTIPVRVIEDDPTFEPPDGALRWGRRFREQIDLTHFDEQARYLAKRDIPSEIIRVITTRTDLGGSPQIVEWFWTPNPAPL